MEATQLTLAERARDEAMDRVERHAPPEWKVLAKRAIMAVAREMPEFTADDIWERVGPPPEPRALGPIMRRAAKVHICEMTDRTKKSKRPECHRRPLQVWKSLLYKP